MQRALFIFLTSIFLVPLQGQMFQCEESSVTFISKAALETIQAKTNDLKGILKIENKTFAFSIDIMSFEGFNSALQKEHFRENYMEVSKYPKAIFSGVIIEELTFNKNETLKLRAKGKLTIHGVTVERIIPLEMTFQNQEINAHSSFNVSLSDHNIVIPKIVHRKINEEIKVDVRATFRPKK